MYQWLLRQTAVHVKVGKTTMATTICIECGQPLEVPDTYQGTVEYRGADGQRYTVDYGAGAWMHLDCTRAESLAITRIIGEEVASGRQQPD